MHTWCALKPLDRTVGAIPRHPRTCTPLTETSDLLDLPSIPCDPISAVHLFPGGWEDHQGSDLGHGGSGTVPGDNPLLLPGGGWGASGVRHNSATHVRARGQVDEGAEGWRGPGYGYPAGREQE